jgi:hypothetical protein
MTNEQTDWRALCAELADALDEWQLGGGPPEDTADADLIARARAALAQPEPEGLTVEQWDAIKDRLWDKYETVGYLDERFMYQGDFDTALDVARKDLARFARPTIKPVPVAERPWEREGWCDAEGMCWRFDPCDRGWWSYGPILPSDGDPAPFTYLLPHHALPVPQP